MWRVSFAGVWISVAVASSWSQAATVLNFDSLSATTAYSHGVAVPPDVRLADQYLASDGIRFSSGSPYVAVGNYGSHATSGTNMIAGTSAAATFDYAAPVLFSFWDPANPATPATTNFFSLRGDLDPTGGGVNVTVSAFDVNGDLLGTHTVADTGGETWTLSVAGIHSVLFPGTSANPGFGGIALDDVTFNPVVPVPEPGTFAPVIALLLVASRRLRKHG